METLCAGKCNIILMAVLEVLQASTLFFTWGNFVSKNLLSGKHCLKYEKLMLAIHLLCILVVVLDMDDNNVLTEFKHELKNI